MAEFDESKHPRDEKGKFSVKGASKEYRQNASYDEILRQESDSILEKDELDYSSGALKVNTPREVKHTLSFYNQATKRTTDHVKIANLMGMDKDFVKEIKDYIFVPTKTIDYKNAYGDEFTVSYYQAESWRRLSEGKPIEMDIVFLKHEAMELKLRKTRMSYDEAHRIAEKEYNYNEEIIKWEIEYGSDKKKRRRKE